MTDPPARLASLPVSKLSVLSPTMTSRVCIGGDLLPDVQPLDQIGVALRVFRLEVVEQPASAADQHQQATARVMIFRVGLEVLGEVVDALAENRNLYFGRTGVRVVRLVGANQFGLAVFGQRHGLFPSTSAPEPSGTGRAVYQKIPYSNKRNMLHQDHRRVQKPRCPCRLRHPNEVALTIEQPDARRRPADRRLGGLRDRKRTAGDV